MEEDVTSTSGTTRRPFPRCLFCIVDQPPPRPHSIKVTTPLFITSICFMKSQPRGVLFVSFRTHISTYAHAPPTSGKIVLVNEIRLNHALAFHQSLCDGCSPLIHGFHPLRLLPVCADMSNDPLYPAPRRAVDLRDNHGNRGSPLSITLSKHIHNHTSTRIHNIWLLPPSPKSPSLTIPIE